MSGKNEAGGACAVLDLCYEGNDVIIQPVAPGEYPGVTGKNSKPIVGGALGKVDAPLKP